MPETFDLVFKGGTVVNQDGIGKRDIGVSGARIAAIGTIGEDQAGEVVDCTGLHLLPGVIDSQVHFREPGMEHKEDLEAGSRAAVMGGVTAVFEMPNTNPTTTNPEALEDKFARAKDRMHCDHGFWVGATGENVGILPELESMPGVVGVKVFMGSSTGSLLVPDDEGVRAVLSAIRRRAAFHSEDEDRMRARETERVSGDPSSHPVWRDVESALGCTKRLVAIAEETGSPIHVLHISTADEMRFLATKKEWASVEVLPNHLTLAAPDCYDQLGTYAQQNPPIRDKSHQEGLWWGIREGVVDVLGSDHAPHTREEKDKPYPNSPSGTPGVQTLVPIMLDHVNAGRLSLERFVDLTSAGQQRLFGARGKGRLAAGYDADITIVDLRRSETITEDWIVSKSGWTPFAGKTVTGWPVGTIIRGQKVMWEGELVAPSAGQPVRFLSG